MNIGKDFKNYAINHFGYSENDFDDFARVQSTIYNNVTASATPYILEERKLNVTPMDIFSRLMMERIIYLIGPVNEQMSNVVQAQLMYLSQLSKQEIQVYVNSPGGSVVSGLTIVDALELSGCDINTINTGMAASMGSILLGCGTKGKRGMTKNARVMLHQVSAGAYGNVQDMDISMQQTIKFNEKLFEMLGNYTGKSPEQVKNDATRDFWLDAEEALEYGIIDYIVK